MYYYVVGKERFHTMLEDLAELWSWKGTGTEDLNGMLTEVWGMPKVLITAVRKIA